MHGFGRPLLHKLLQNVDSDEMRELLDGLPVKSFAGCGHIAAGALTAYDWRYHQKRTCECCGRGAVSRHPTKRRRTLCEDCGGVMRPRGVAKGKERWVVEIEVHLPADAEHEAEAWTIAERFMAHLEADEMFKDFVGGVDVRPWHEFDELG